MSTRAVEQKNMTDVQYIRHERATADGREQKVPGTAAAPQGSVSHHIIERVWPVITVSRLAVAPLRSFLTAGEVE